jgi:uncharacterized membrane protein (UPF0127 family)
MKEIKLLKRRNSIGGDVFKIVFLGYINLKRKSSICNYKKRLKMVIVNFDYGKKKFKIRADECRGFISKARGLIFQKNPKALMFIFTSKTQQSIHSFFCKPFVAIWFYKGKVVDKQHVDPWRFSVKPKKKFDRLLEIPEGCKGYRSLSR